MGDTGKTKALLMLASAFIGLLETHFNAFMAFAAKSQEKRGEGAGKKSPELSGKDKFLLNRF